ncbi:MAG: hypothetical protein ACLFU8_15510 [Anaerolineales bacterium]
MAKSRLSSSGKKSRLSSSKRKSARKSSAGKSPLSSQPRKVSKSPIRTDRLKKIRRAPSHQNPYIRSRGCLGCLLPVILSLLVVLAVLVVAL